MYKLILNTIIIKVQIIYTFYIIIIYMFNVYNNLYVYLYSFTHLNKQIRRLDAVSKEKDST